MRIPEELGLFSPSSRVFQGDFSKNKYKLKYMEAADFTENVLKEILRKHVLASISSNLVVFLENNVTDFFSYALLKFLTNVTCCNLMQLVVFFNLFL